MDSDPKEVLTVELVRVAKSAGVFEAKQKASHAKESLKLLDIEYWSQILLHTIEDTAELHSTAVQCLVHYIMKPIFRPRAPSYAS
jgi:hypothetical protein